jgi:alkylhydroperoxidase family enzyme
MTPLIHWIDDDEATGAVAEVYNAWKAANPQRERIPGILKCFSARPDFLKAVADFSYSLHFQDGHLTRRVKEMIATFVSALNQCPY